MATPHITDKQLRALLASFIADTTATQAIEQMIERDEDPVSRPCAIRYFRYWRELIRDHQLRKYPRFSGEVEIDLGFFGGRGAKWMSSYVRKLAGLPAGRIVAKRKQIRKYEKKKQPVLGILNRGGDVFILPIKSKNRLHLEGAIRMIVEPGAVIYSDMEKGLANLKLDGYIHHQIDHSKGPVDANGYHINGIENFWREAKRGMTKNFRGIPRTTIDMHIKEREFRYNHRKDFSTAFRALLPARDLPGKDKVATTNDRTPPLRRSRIRRKVRTNSAAKAPRTRRSA